MGCTLALTWMYEGVLGWGKRQVERLADTDILARLFVDADERAAWRADTHGALFFGDEHTAMTVIMPLLIPGLVWLFLPR